MLQAKALAVAGGLVCLLTLRRRRRGKRAAPELLYSCAVVRHGARGPTRKALYLACGERRPEQYARRDEDACRSGQVTDHPATGPAQDVWSPEEPEALTDVGRTQLRRVGEWFKRYVRDHGLESALGQ